MGGAFLPGPSLPGPGLQAESSAAGVTESGRAPASEKLRSLPSLNQALATPLAEMTEPNALKQDIGREQVGLGVGPLPPVGSSKACLAPVLLSVKGQIVVIISSTSQDNLLQV